MKNSTLHNNLTFHDRNKNNMKKKNIVAINRRFHLNNLYKKFSCSFSCFIKTEVCPRYSVLNFLPLPPISEWEVEQLFRPPGGHLVLNIGSAAALPIVYGMAKFRTPIIRVG